MGNARRRRRAARDRHGARDALGQWEQPALHAKLALVALIGVAVVWHMRRPQRRFLEGLVFVASLAIVWLGLTLAH